MTDSYPWFSRLVRHPARKWSGSILTTRSPHGASLRAGHYGTTTNLPKRKTAYVAHRL